MQASVILGSKVKVRHVLASFSNALSFLSDVSFIFHSNLSQRFYYFFNKSCNCSVLVLNAVKGVMVLLAHLSKLKKKAHSGNGAFLWQSHSKSATE